MSEVRALGMYNAAPEWQAESFGRRSRKLLVACPLQGLVMHL
jgi:hypothetical protein